MDTTCAQAPDGNDSLLNLVAFKRLMAGQGYRVDLLRLQRDKAYIDDCLQRALGCDSELLREHSLELPGLQLCSVARWRPP